MQQLYCAEIVFTQAEDAYILQLFGVEKGKLATSEIEKKFKEAFRKVSYSILNGRYNGKI